MEKSKKEIIWTYYKGLHGWAVYNEKFKYISHYEETQVKAMMTCIRWNREGREF